MTMSIVRLSGSEAKHLAWFKSQLCYGWKIATARGRPLFRYEQKLSADVSTASGIMASSDSGDSLRIITCSGMHTPLAFDVRSESIPLPAEGKLVLRW